MDWSAPLAASGTFTLAYHCRAGVSGESWQPTAIINRQSKRPVKWDRTPYRRNAPQVNVDRLQRILIVLGSPPGKNGIYLNSRFVESLGSASLFLFGSVSKSSALWLAGSEVLRGFRLRLLNRGY